MALIIGEAVYQVIKYVTWINSAAKAQEEWNKDENGRLSMQPTGKTETIKADLVFLALGFVHPVQEGLLTELGVKFDARGNIATNKLSTSNVSKVFAAGDAAVGASLVVRAIAGGRKAAEDIHNFLK